MNASVLPDLGPDPGWNQIDKPAEAGGPSSFVSGEPKGDRLRVRYFQREHDGALVGKVWFGPATQGPPGHVHGGAIAAVLDESMGGAAWLEGHIALAAQLSVTFRKMVPTGTVATLEACVQRVDGRKIHTRGHILCSDGEVFSEACGLFLTLDADVANKIFKGFTDAAERLHGRVTE